MILLANCHVAALKASEIQYARNGQHEVYNRTRVRENGEVRRENASHTYLLDSRRPIDVQRAVSDPDLGLSIAHCPLQMPIGAEKRGVGAGTGASGMRFQGKDSSTVVQKERYNVTSLREDCQGI
jgi:hypothetical protein